MNTQRVYTGKRTVRRAILELAVRLLGWATKARTDRAPVVETQYIVVIDVLMLCC